MVCRRDQVQASVVLPVSCVAVLNFPSNYVCDALPTREAYLSLGVQGSH